MDISKQGILIHNYDKRPTTSKALCAMYTFLLTAVACLVGATGSTVLMLGVAVMYVPLILKPEHLLGPILFFTIFDDYLLVASNASVSRFMTLFFIFSATLIILKKGSIKQTSLFFLLLIAIDVILSFYSSYGYTSLPISVVLNILLAIAMLNFSTTSAKDIAEQLYKYAALAIAYVYFLLWKNGFDSLVDGTRMTIGENVNSNALAMGLAIIMTTLVANLLIIKKNVISSIALIVADCVALFLTGSRTALIAAIVASFLLYLINAQGKRGKRRAILLLLFSSALLVLIYKTLAKNFPILMERFTVENVEESGGTGRMDVWRHYFTIFFPKYWLFGMGYDPRNLYYGLVSLNIEAHGAHNIIVEILSRAGVVGLTLYTVYFTKFFFVTIKKIRKNKYLLLPIAIVLTTLLNGIGENVLDARLLWFGVGLGYMLLYASASNENEALSGGDHNAR